MWVYVGVFFMINGVYAENAVVYAEKYVSGVSFWS